MTNREESNAAEHETFPGPGPLRADEAKRGIRPVEQMVDAAIDRIARENEAGRDSDPSQLDPGRLTPDRMTPDRMTPDRMTPDRVTPDRMTAGRADPGHALALARQDGPSTLATAASVRRAKGRLRWKGLDVSEEFRSYADRVARGEDLPPFQGKILAEPDPAFPWDPAARLRAHSHVLKRQFGLWTGVALFLGLSVWVLVVQVGKQTDASQRAAESPLATVVLGNQPNSDAPKLGAPTAAEAASAEATAEEATEPSPKLAAQGTTALASLQERSSPPARTVPSNPSTLRPAAASASATSNATASTPNSVGTLVATRAATGDGAGSNLKASGVAPAVPGQTTIAAPVSPHIVAAGGVGAGGVVGAGVSAGTAAPSGAPVAATTASPTDPATSTAGHTDPKKEPGREASTMGPLLVEKPSF